MFSGRKKSLTDIIISCQADSPACVIHFEHNAGLWLEHCFQLKSGCDLAGEGCYPDWQVCKRRLHVWRVEWLGEPIWGVKEWLRDQAVRIFPFVLLPPAGWKGAGGIPQCWGIPWWWAPASPVQKGFTARLVRLSSFYHRAHGQNREGGGIHAGKFTPKPNPFQG